MFCTNGDGPINDRRHTGGFYITFIQTLETKMGVIKGVHHGCHFGIKIPHFHT